MKASRYILTAVVAAVAMLAPKPASAITLNQIIAAIAPPAIPTLSYQQPAPPAPNSMWIPGYWRWNGSSYQWIQGRWTSAPRPGQYWTPAYWAQTPAGYVYHSGYWGSSVGYYGNVDYGHGYFGKGYDGGQWQGKNFRYNSYVTHVDKRTAHDAYYNRNVYERSPQQNRESFARQAQSNDRNHGHGAGKDHGHGAGKDHGHGGGKDHGHGGGKGHGHGGPPR